MQALEFATLGGCEPEKRLWSDFEPDGTSGGSEITANKG
jgi:hypothetical protein